MTFGILGYGRFGKLWAEILKKSGKVFVFDKIKNPEKINGVHFVSLKKAVSVDILFLLVPVSRFKECCQEIKPLLKPNTLVVDGCAVKIYPAKIMKKIFSKNQPLIATHPMFGPDSVKKLGIEGRKIVIASLRSTKKQLQGFESILREIGLKIIHASPGKHDQQMANSQALVHFLGRGLAGLNLNPQQIATPDFEALLRIDSMVNNDTWQLFFDMQTYNPLAKRVRQKLIRSLQKIDHLIQIYETNRKNS